ncbi:copper resistance CopC/CopD family protein [Jatrophihabitans sp. YIM 134969]
MRTATRRWCVLLAAFAVVVLTALVGAPDAAAHATVTGSNPADGADVPTTPTTVSISFDEAVTLDPGFVKVVDGNGGEVESGKATVSGDGRTVEAPLKSGLPRSAGYLVSFRVVSADGHPVSGTVAFTVAGGTPVSPTDVGSGTSPLVEGFLDAGAAIGFIGFGVAGGAWLVISRRAGVLDSRRVRVVVRGGLLLALAGSVIQVLLHGPYVAGAGSTDSPWSLLADTVRSAFGIAQLVVIVALLGVLTLARRIERMTEPLHPAQQRVIGAAAVLWVVALGALAAAGHARVRPPVWLSFPSTVLHLLAVTTWVGGVVVLLAVVVPNGDPAAAVLVRRLSRVAVWCVVVVAVTGVVQAWLETSSFSALTDTTYGRLVIVKSALFLVLVGLGALARWWLRTDEPVRAVRRGLVVEAVVMAGVLAVTSVLISEPPARTAYAAEIATRPASTTASLGGSQSATVTVTPARRGAVGISVRLAGTTEVEDVSISALQQKRGIGPVEVDLEWQGGPLFTASGVVLPVSGPWTFTLRVRASQFDAVVADVTIDLA